MLGRHNRVRKTLDRNKKNRGRNNDITDRKTKE